MKASEIAFDRLLKFAPKEGKIHLGGSRALLINAGALGVLRKALIDTVGFDYARRLFSQCGYACGYEDALTLKKSLRINDDLEWLMAGPLMHSQVGHVLVEPIEFRLDRKKGDFLVKARWRNSYEAEQHRRYLGVSKEPACWTLSGYASGWSTAVLGERALCLETACEGRGDPHCLLEIRRISEWGERARGREHGLEGIALQRDVSVLEEVVRNLRASQAAEREAKIQFKTVLDSAADMVWIRDVADGRLLEINEAMVRELGYPREKLVGRPVFDFYYSDKDRASGEKFTRSVQSRGSAFLSVTFRARSGEPLEVELRGSILEYGGGKAMLVVARSLDEALKQRRRAAIFYEAFRRSNDVMFYCDRNAVILDVNDAFTKHYGWTREEAIGNTPRILRSRHSTEELYKRMWSSILDPAKAYWRGEMINRTKDGREIPVILTITAVKDPGGEIIGYLSNAVDLTEQVALQARVAQSEALATIGEMAAVVAHEIRNPLGSIVMAAKQIAAGKLGKEDRETVLQVIRSESQRLNEALSNFLAYARPREIKLERGDLNALVEEVSNIVKSNPELVKSIRVRVAPAPGLKAFPMDPDQIRQVVWNMVLNAVQAMDGRGTLTVETGRDKGHAWFRVRDTGPGIPESALASIFKPFQTTKQQGTGLGLAIADRIVKAHGGRIEVETEPGRGTAFTVHIPSVED